MRPRTVLALLIVAVVAAGCTEGLREAAETLSPSAAPSPSTPDSATASPSASPSTSREPGAAPIEVSAPEPDLEIASPVVVRGTAVSATGAVAVRIIDEGGMELAATNVELACGAGCRDGFRVALAFFVELRQAGTVEVSVIGSGEIAAELVEVPVVLVPGV